MQLGLRLNGGSERKLTLPTDSKVRKEYPIWRGFFQYFPAAIAGAANISKRGNDKHNPGQDIHHARGKSMDHGDCVLRHLLDAGDLLARYDRAQACSDEAPTPNEILEEVNQLVWRSLAFSQELHERFGAPLAPAARLDG